MPTNTTEGLQRMASDDDEPTADQLTESCPRCGRTILAIEISGPGEERYVPCGHRAVEVKF